MAGFSLGSFQERIECCALRKLLYPVFNVVGLNMETRRRTEVFFGN